MRLLTAFCIAVLAVAIATPAFAAVQNIKVSGEIGARVLFLSNYDLKDESLESTNITTPPGAAGSGLEINDDDDSFALTTVRVGIDSDLTDNVSASIVLDNQTRWGDQPGAADNINLNQAYITLKEFFYSPLTLKIGRQNLTYGQGFIVGPGLFRDPNGVFPQPTDTVWDPMTRAFLGATPVSGPMGAQYSDSNSYDALRATIDLDPYTIDGVFALINELDTGVAGASADEYLTGVNVEYKFDVYKAGLEGYYFFNRDDSFNSTLGYVRQSTIIGQAAIGAPNYPENNAARIDTTVAGVGARAYEESEIHVIGLRGDIEPLENLTLSGEGAYQFGKLVDDLGPWNTSTSGGMLDRDRSAWAVNLEGNYTWNEVAYKPNLGGGYVYLSGEEAGNAGDFNAWDPMFKGKFFSAIRDFQAGDQLDWLGNDGTGAFGSALYATKDENDSAGATNSHILFVDGGLRPLEDLTLKARYLHFWFDERPVDGRNSSIGDEVDASLVYDYTEDVQMDLTGAWFIPGKYYDGATEYNGTTGDFRSNDIATAITGSVRVAF